MTKPRSKAATNPGSPGPEAGFTLEQTPDQVRAILWKIAGDHEQSGTARVAACRLLLMDAREGGDDGDHHNADINRRAINLMRQRAAN